ncbi:Uncharacterized conserved protein [Tistlia consotensis]|uniref:Uncharacterized conserved protein n=1 Tax=Tistlia consotensis USBA 355 TaxID=560819 RepID=A0A1Y6BR31_9PROT|nr:GFA family protein [Tistlia consotensis]SMF16562.1 Uncharacterized conserved protein [Tistlia consotensis USBA 355]SNR41046.1 Uncharacterized conserved protein [Tistlia consotensis]
MTAPSTGTLAGGCLCGAVRFELTGTPRPPVACHCSQCRRTSGHYGVFTAVPLDGFRLTAAGGLKWFRSSDVAERGFCGDCGSSLFWKPSGAGYVAVAAGALDKPTGLSLAGHIFAADKGDYYALADGLPVYPGGDGGRLDAGASKQS